MALLLGQWLNDNRDTLGWISTLLIGIGTLFGGSVLGNFPQLKQRGGFYSSVIVAISAGVMTGAVFYAIDVTSGGSYSQLANVLFHITVNSAAIAIAFGTLGAIPSLTSPEAQRLYPSIIFKSRRLLQNPNEFQELFENWPRRPLIGILNTYLGRVIGYTWITFGILRLSGIPLTLTPLILVVIIGLPLAQSLIYSMLMSTGYKAIAFDKIAQPTIDNLSSSASDSEINNAIKVAKKAKNLYFRSMLVAWVRVLINWLIRIAYIAVVIYYATLFGWAIPIYVIAVPSAARLLILILRRLADKIHPNVLTAILAVSPFMVGTLLTHVPHGRLTL